MYYNLIKFGETLLKIRQNLGLTQEDVSELALMSIETIRRIESGKVTPKHETLDYLSLLYKTDLNKLFLEFRIDNYEKFTNIRNKIDLKLDGGNYENLDIELSKLKNLINTTSNVFYISLIKQYILLIESIILSENKHNPLESYNKLIDAISLTCPEFSIYQYQDFNYSNMEIRLLMTIALMINRIESPNTALKILEFCANHIEPNANIYPRSCYNLSYSYHRVSQYKRALEYANLGIKSCIEYRNYSGLNLLYFRKGIAEFLLKYDNYMDSLNKSLNQCEILGQDKLKDSIINSCKKIYNIDI